MEQASRDPDNYFNLRMLTCPAAEMVDGSRVLYIEQEFWRTPQKPFRKRFCMVKPCPKEMKCDVELSSFAIRDAEEYKNFCDRPREERPLPEEVIGLNNKMEEKIRPYIQSIDKGVLPRPIIIQSQHEEEKISFSTYKLTIEKEAMCVEV